VLVPAEDQVELGGERGELRVVGHAQVGEGDEHVGRVAQPARRAPRRLERVGEARPRRAVGRDHDPHDPDAHRAPAHLARDDRVRAHAGERAPGRVGDVGGEHREAGLGEVGAEGRLAHVELVVAEHGDVEAEGVEGGHHLPPGEAAAAHARGAERGRRQVVAAERGEERRRGVAERAAERGHARQAAAPPALDGGDLVDVVEVQDAQGDGVGAAGRGVGRAREGARGARGRCQQGGEEGGAGGPHGARGGRGERRPARAGGAARSTSPR
jgi:hypothetical protein